MKDTPRAEQVYELLVSDDDARACKDIDENACQVVPGNFLLLLIGQWLTKLSDTFSSAKLVLPWLLSSAGVPAFFSGLLVPIRESGSLLPQLAIASVMRSYPVRKWFLVLGGVLQGVGLLALAAAAATLTGSSAGWAIVAALVVIRLARGFSSVASKDVTGKTIPKTRRGSLNGISASAAGVATLGLGVALLFNLSQADDWLIPLLIAAAAATFLSSLVFARVQEYEGATSGGANGFKAALDSAGILITDADFRRFITVRALMMSSGLCAPFFILLAQQAQDSRGILSLGMFIVVSGLASLCSGFIWGRLSDLSSRTVMQITAAATAAICAVAAVVSEHPSLSVYLLLGLYFLLSVIHEGVRVGRKTYVLDMAGGQKRTDYVSVGNTLIGVLLLITGVLSAGVAHLSLTWVLTGFALMSGAGFLLSFRLRPV